MLGLLDPAEGEMRVDGEAVTPETRRAWQKTLGYVPQTIFLSDGTVAENIAFGMPPDQIDHAAVERAAGSRRSTISSRRSCRTATPRPWANAACGFRAGSGSASGSRGRSITTRPC
jgi:ABC-type sugar transport system ATPase subunit